MGGCIFQGIERVFEAFSRLCSLDIAMHEKWHEITLTTEFGELL